MAKLRYIVEARYANFTIHVGKDEYKQPKRSFRVSEERLSVKSKIWEAQIQAAHDRGEQSCWFTEDRPRAIEIILHVIHGNSWANPSRCSQEIKERENYYFVIAGLDTNSTRNWTDRRI
jgi:hypothetical protein